MIIATAPVFLPPIHAAVRVRGASVGRARLRHSDRGEGRPIADLTLVRPLPSLKGLGACAIMTCRLTGSPACPRRFLAAWKVSPRQMRGTLHVRTRGTKRSRRNSMKKGIHPRIRGHRRDLHVRQHVPHPFHDHLRRDARGRVLGLPPVLHGQAEDPRHRRPRRQSSRLATASARR